GDEHAKVPGLQVFDDERQVGWRVIDDQDGRHGTACGGFSNGHRDRPSTFPAAGLRARYTGFTLLPGAGQEGTGGPPVRSLCRGCGVCLWRPAASVTRTVL